ncbi:MAG: long-chain fatty acid--CoA ligase [Betaproteobacteria bacterium]|nr:long-chain fatty acid--CoA ligase [Betaproteobacteria bacterium]
MQSTMMRFPLTLDHILERAGKLFGKSEIVSRLPDRTLHRYAYNDFHRRARALAGALQRLGLKRGDRVATLMWNHYAHLEAYFAVPCAGGVLHTLNLRLHPDDIAYIANHAGDRFLIVDDILLPLYDKFRDRARFEQVIVVSLSREKVAERAGSLPSSGTPTAGRADYEALISDAAPFTPPALDENDAAGMCYTSGTTGKPKGVVYSHRSIVLHSLATATVDYMGVAHADAVCPVVPMFHVNAWGIPFTAVMMGSKLVFPGPHLDAESLLDLYQSEQVTLTAGVPTIWMSILQALEKAPARWRLAPGMRMVVGGAAASETMIRAFDKFGLRVTHGWGMTETSPVGTVNYLKRELGGRSAEEQYVTRAKQGMPLPFFEVRAMGGEAEVPWDGMTMGELQVRGPWVAAGYHDLDQEADKWTADGWFRTGDIVTIDAAGYVKITDRIKDLVKSGGEWISSIDLENALASHPRVAEAAVIAVPHPKWGERPLAVVVLKAGDAATEEELRDHLATKFAKFWLPDGIVFVNEIPRTSTGKMMKAVLRERYRDWRKRDEE